MIRPRELSGATPGERRAWLLVSPLLVAGVVTVGVGVGTGNPVVVSAGPTVLLVAYVVGLVVVLRLQRRAHVARLAELAAHNAVTFERHERERGELEQLRRTLHELRELRDGRDDVS